MASERASGRGAAQLRRVVWGLSWGCALACVACSGSDDDKGDEVSAGSSGAMSAGSAAMSAGSSGAAHVAGSGAGNGAMTAGAGGTRAAGSGGTPSTAGTGSGQQDSGTPDEPEPEVDAGNVPAGPI